MASDSEILGVPKRQWVRLRRSLLVAALVLFAIAARFMMHVFYPLDEDLVYSLLYLQALVLALIVGFMWEIVKRILKRSPSVEPSTTFQRV